MKLLTDLEKHIWKINNPLQPWKDSFLESQSWHQEIEKVRDLAALCERKMREAIELARGQQVYRGISGSRVDSGIFYSTEEIIQKLSNPE